MNDPRFEVYPEMFASTRGGGDTVPTGRFRWRLRAANGQIVATAGEGFTREADAARAIGDAFGAGVAACDLRDWASGRVRINVLNTDDKPQTVSVSYVKD